MNLIKIFKDERKIEEKKQVSIKDMPWSIVDIVSSLEEAQKMGDKLMLSNVCKTVMIKAVRVSGEPTKYSVGIM